MLRSEVEELQRTLVLGKDQAKVACVPCQIQDPIVANAELEDWLTCSPAGTQLVRIALALGFESTSLVSSWRLQTTSVCQHSEEEQNTLKKLRDMTVVPGPSSWARFGRCIHLRMCGGGRGQDCSCPHHDMGLMHPRDANHSCNIRRHCNRECHWNGSNRTAVACRKPMLVMSI